MGSYAPLSSFDPDDYRIVEYDPSVAYTNRMRGFNRGRDMSLGEESYYYGRPSGTSRRDSYSGARSRSSGSGWRGKAGAAYGAGQFLYDVYKGYEVPDSDDPWDNSTGRRIIHGAGDLAKTGLYGLPGGALFAPVVDVELDLADKFMRRGGAIDQLQHYAADNVFASKLGMSVKDYRWQKEVNLNRVRAPSIQIVDKRSGKVLATHEGDAGFKDWGGGYGPQFAIKYDDPVTGKEVGMHRLFNGDDNFKYLGWSSADHPNVIVRLESNGKALPSSDRSLIKLNPTGKVYGGGFVGGNGLVRASRVSDPPRDVQPDVVSAGLNNVAYWLKLYSDLSD